MVRRNPNPTQCRTRILKSVLAKLADTDLQSAMLAPPQRRRRNPIRKHRPLAERRRVDLARKHRQLDRERAGLRRYQLWLSDRAVEGLIKQLIITGELSDEQAYDHRKLEAALTTAFERQGLVWEL